MKLPGLKEVRELHGWSQAKLAEESGVSRDSISNYETGHREPWPATAKRLADALGVEIEDLARPKVTAPSTSGQPETGEDRGFSTSKTREFLLPKERGTGRLEALAAEVVRQEAEIPASQEAEEAAEAEYLATLEKLLNELDQVVEAVSDEDEKLEVSRRVSDAYGNLLDGLERSLKPIAEAEKRRGRRRSESPQSRR